jgi:hypothetical protein
MIYDHTVMRRPAKFDSQQNLTRNYVGTLSNHTWLYFQHEEGVPGARNGTRVRAEESAKERFEYSRLIVKSVVTLLTGYDRGARLRLRGIIIWFTFLP